MSWDSEWSSPEQLRPPSSSDLQQCPTDSRNRPGVRCNIGEQFCSTMSWSAFPVQDEPLDLSVRSTLQSRPHDLTTKGTGAAESGISKLPFQKPLLHDPENSSLKQETTEIRHDCPTKVKSFSAEWGLSQHMSHIELKQLPSDASGESFAQMSDLSGHLMMQYGQKPHSCDICSKAFSWKSHLKAHMLTHSGQKPHSCGICSKAFCRKHDLNRHILIHSGQKPHTCGICSKAFSRKSRLKTHMLTHSGQKPHSCGICSKAFCRKCDLKRHMLTHSGQKPHTCGICSKAFSQKSDLKRHTLTHSGQKPHTCEMCPKAFSRKSQLKRHVLTHSGEEPSSGHD